MEPTVGDLLKGVLKEREELWARVESLERDQYHFTRAMLWLAEHGNETPPRRIRLALSKAKRRMSKLVARTAAHAVSERVA